MSFDNLPDVIPANSLPILTAGPNSSPIDASFAALKPTTVLGALLHKPTAKVFAKSSVLKPGTKLEVTTTKDVVMDNFIENDVAFSASWLSFIAANLNFSTKAEVSIVKILTSSVDLDQVDDAKWQKILSNVSVPGQYSIICGFICYQFNASLYKDIGMDVNANGYGAKIGGKWFSKTGSLISYPYLMAIWWPLTDYSNLPAARSVHQETNLVALAEKAIKSGSLEIDSLESGKGLIMTDESPPLK